LPVLAFPVPPNSEKILTPAYSNRLMRNFANLMIADKYAEAVRGITPLNGGGLILGGLWMRWI
jgi:hypothetical protein